MNSDTYLQRRQQLTTYFDETAAATWAKLTSSDPVGRVRATVRAGRDRMRETMLGWLPHDLRDCRLLDAGCGTGALALEAARRGADVVAVDVAGKLISVAQQRLPREPMIGSVEFRVGDMLGPELGRFDYVVAMDSLIHYREEDMVEAMLGLAERADRAVIATFAPRTALLTAMHMVGRLIPYREHRAPGIQPVKHSSLERRLNEKLEHIGWQAGRTQRIDSGFYISQAQELRHG